MKVFFQSLHHRLLPQDANVGVLPYIWLVYLGMFLATFAFYEPPTWHYWAGAAGTLGFLGLYFRAFWVSGKRILGYIAAMTLVGVLMTMVNSGSAVFFIFACAFANQFGSVRANFIVVSAVLACVAVTAWVLSQPLFFTLPALVFSLLIGAINIFENEIRRKNALLKLSQDEVQRLAASEERERIARDLHDVIGHTLSMITMKAQLANKLFDHDAQQARKEMAEVESISRQALSEVREAVSGYREKDLQSELANARTMLGSAEIALTCDVETLSLPKQIDATLGYVVREAVTNLVRHSKATACRLEINADKHRARLHVSDNGDCQQVTEGNGLLGMRERIENLGGSIAFRAADGFNIDIEVPL